MNNFELVIAGASLTAARAISRDMHALADASVSLNEAFATRSPPRIDANLGRRSDRRSRPRDPAAP
jgi:hypothetical protein